LELQRCVKKRGEDRGGPVWKKKVGKDHEYRVEETKNSKGTGLGKEANSWPDSH